MNQKYLKVVVPAVLLLPVVLFVAISIKSSLPDTHPLMQIHAKKVTGVKIIPMTDAQRSKAGGSESNFLLSKMFSKPDEYTTFPLIQKKKALLGVAPIKIADVAPQADFAISGAGIKTFYKLQNRPRAGKEAMMVAIPQLRGSKMGKIPNPKDWLKPNDFAYPGKYPYYFPLLLRKTPYGDIVYRVYISNENPNINKVMEAYMKSKRLKPLE